MSNDVPQARASRGHCNSKAEGTSQMLQAICNSMAPVFGRANARARPIPAGLISTSYGLQSGYVGGQAYDALVRPANGNEGYTNEANMR
jgi:hypothetical protein